MGSSSIRHQVIHFFLIFGLIPVLLFFGKPRGAIYMALWVMAIIAWCWLREKQGYDLKKEWNLAALDRALIKKIVRRFLPFAAALLLFTWLVIPDRLFSLPRERPVIWAWVMIWYPILSVFPQEILFRSFFFRYYASWLKNPRAMILVNAATFGWIHIVLHNWVAVVFSAIGGVMFGHTYYKTRSLAAVCFEHALYGCYVFTLGLGYYFYHGQAVR